MSAPALKKCVADCRRKSRYPDIYSAAASGAHMSIEWGTAEVYVYPCPHCRGYHLTHKATGEDSVWVFALYFGKMGGV